MLEEPMSGKPVRDRHILEIMLVLVVVGCAALFLAVGGHRAVVLNLFYLPVVLAGYFLGRQMAGALAFFCALAVGLTLALDSTGFSAAESPISIGLTITIWAAVLGLTAILVGTLCDERAATLDELHRAYVGVVEVLTRYLQGGNTKLQDRSVRVAGLSQAMAKRMNLAPKQIDDIRVAALLNDLGNVEVTTQLANRAIHTLMDDAPGAMKHTFSGSELVHSLGAVLEDALPLVAHLDDSMRDHLIGAKPIGEISAPIGAEIIRVARAYDELVFDCQASAPMTPEQAVGHLRKDVPDVYSDAVVNVLEQIVGAGQPLVFEPAIA